MNFHLPISVAQGAQNLDSSKLRQWQWRCVFVLNQARAWSVSRVLKQKQNWPRSPEIWDPCKVAIHVPAGISCEVLKIHFNRYLRGIYVGFTCGIYTVPSSNIRQIRGNRCSFWWWGVVVSSNFVCGALAFLFILSSRPFLPPCACPSAAVFIATDHGCAHTDKCEMLLKISSRFHDDVTDWRKFHFPRDSRVITCVNLNLGSVFKKIKLLWELLHGHGPGVRRTNEHSVPPTCSVFRWKAPVEAIIGWPSGANMLAHMPNAVPLWAAFSLCLCDCCVLAFLCLWKTIN